MLTAPSVGVPSLLITLAPISEPQTLPDTRQITNYVTLAVDMVGLRVFSLKGRERTGDSY